MKRRACLATLALVVVLGTFSASAQVDEARVAEALDQIGHLLGLSPVGPSELREKVVSIGGLPFESDVPIDFMERSELARYLRDLFDEEYEASFAAREERMMRGFGFLRDGEDLRDIRQRVLNENIAGFYDERPGVKRLYAISSGRELGVMNQLVLAHELRHALQDQHVVIGDKLAVESDYDDRRLAALSLFEGDASVLMEQYLTSGVGAGSPELAGLFQVFSQSLSGEDVARMFAGPALRDAPPIVQEQLIAPYFQGRNFAVAVFERGGFPRLNDTLKSPPRSMEQVLHPEKYLEPGRVDEPKDVGLGLAANAPVDFEGRLGELYVRVLLRRAGPPDTTDETAERAAEGWGGDAYAVLREGASYRLLWKSVWDTEADAVELEQALRAYAAGRFPGEAIRIERDGDTVTFERPAFQ